MANSTITLHVEASDTIVSSHGPDGWDIRELRALPPSLQDLLGHLIDEAESDSTCAVNAIV